MCLQNNSDKPTSAPRANGNHVPEISKKAQQMKRSGNVFETLFNDAIERQKRRKEFEEANNDEGKVVERKEEKEEQEEEKPKPTFLSSFVLYSNPNSFKLFLALLPLANLFASDFGVKPLI